MQLGLRGEGRREADAMRAGNTTPSLAWDRMLHAHTGVYLYVCFEVPVAHLSACGLHWPSTQPPQPPPRVRAPAFLPIRRLSAATTTTTIVMAAGSQHYCRCIFADNEIAPCCHVALS